MDNEVAQEGNGLENTETNGHPWNIIVYCALGLVSIIAGIELYSFFNFFPGFDSSHEAWGTTGDFFGGTLNPLLQFVVIAMLFWTIRIQQSELKATREELKQSRKANELSAASLQTQAEFQRTQLELSTIEKLLEDSFNEFSILAEQKSIVMQLDGGNGSGRANSLSRGIKIIITHGHSSVIQVSAFHDSAANEIVISNSQSLIVDQIKLLENYTREKGSIYYIEFWVKRLIPIIQLYKKFPGVARYECIGYFDKWVSELPLILEEQEVNAPKLLNIIQMYRS